MDLGETGVAGGARLPALGRIGVRDLGVCPENNGITFRVIMGWHLGHGVQVSRGAAEHPPMYGTAPTTNSCQDLNVSHAKVEKL